MRKSDFLQLMKKIKGFECDGHIDVTTCAYVGVHLCVYRSNFVCQGSFAAERFFFVMRFFGLDLDAVLDLVAVFDIGFATAFFGVAFLCCFSGPISAVNFLF